MKLIFENWRRYISEEEEKEKSKKDLKSDIITALRKEGGAAGMDGDKGLKAHTGASAGEIKAAVSDMPEVGVHPDGDYILDAGDIEVIDEGKICPAGKAWAKSTFDTYPSAYANLAASKYCKDPNYAKGSKKKRKKNETIDEACWDTHKQVGMKKKGGRMVPNCVPKEGIEEGDLQKWLDQDWVRIGSGGKIKGKCGTSKDKKNPDRCLPRSKAQGLSKKQRASTAKKKKRAQKTGRDSGKTSYVSNTKAAKVRNT